MKIFKLIFSILLLISSIQSFGQNADIYTVKFKFHHSRRIPDNYVSVSFERYGDSIHVFAESIPKDTISLKWKETKRKYSFEISMVDFQKVVTAVTKINCTDIASGLSFSGHDGTTCGIEIGGLGNGITYRVWTPNYNTQQRNLQPFLDACKVILLTAKLDPEKIL